MLKILVTSIPGFKVKQINMCFKVLLFLSLPNNNYTISIFVPAFLDIFQHSYPSKMAPNKSQQISVPIVSDLYE